MIIRREIEKDIVKWLGSKEIIAIRGTRQCGKTTFLTMLSEILEKRGINKKNIHFISFEDDIEKEKFEQNPVDYIQFHTGNSDSRHFFLLDEVQYIKSAGKILKLVYDSIKNIKIVITGSSTLDLNEVSSFLVGRVLLFEMYPFSFAEYLNAKDETLHAYYKKRKIILNSHINLEKAVFLDKLNKYLQEYLEYGGYPSVVLENDKEKKKFLLKNLFLTYLEKDIVKVYGLKYKQKISELIKYLAALNGSMLNYNELCGLTGLYDKEIKEILSILQDTYVLKIIKPFHKNLTTELKKNPKTYFVDTGLRNSITGRFEFGNDEFGKLLENYILGKFRQEKVNYWRTTAKAEVDFILNESVPIEVKITPKISRSFRSFIESYKPDKAFIANMNFLETKKIGKTKIFIVPFALL